jgi:pimeloyl-ACP methyl ester carboxylesterase
MKQLGLTIPLLVCAALTCSCNLIDLKHNVKKVESFGVVGVEVNAPAATAPTYALAWTATTESKTNKMIGFQQVDPGGVAVFLLRQKNKYNVGAFTDLNKNGTYDGGEPMDFVRDVKPTPLSDTTNRSATIPLRLSPTNGLPRGQSATLPEEDKELGEALGVAIGQVVKLSDPRFTVEIGEMGMWKPYEFLQQYGFGIYFLEPYQANKTPVLFVYGISGSPQDWKDIIEKLDRKKYQPWFFYYPSGLRLDKIANALAGGVILLQKRYGFDHIDVVAHSMGGLVSHGAIRRIEAETKENFVPHFISISTPWAGHEAAEMGVKHLRFPVPSWRDMSQNSSYLKDVAEHPLPKSTRHDLIFGYKSAGGFGMPDDNDGVVGVESQLSLPVQQRAASVFGLHQEHMEILKSPVVMERIEQYLAH